MGGGGKIRIVAGKREEPYECIERTYTCAAPSQTRLFRHLPGGPRRTCLNQLDRSWSQWCRKAQPRIWPIRGAVCRVGWAAEAWAPSAPSPGLAQDPSRRACLGRHGRGGTSSAPSPFSLPLFACLTETLL